MVTPANLGDPEIGKMPVDHAILLGRNIIPENLIQCRLQESAKPIISKTSGISIPKRMLKVLSSSGTEHRNLIAIMKKVQD